MPYKEEVKIRAKELVLSFYQKCNDRESHMTYERAKQCALITVNEMLKENPYPLSDKEAEELNTIGLLEMDEECSGWGYWTSIKKEINKLR